MGNSNDNASNDKASNYVGRYAPSPTGELHLGNLRTAVLAWLHARLHKGEFLLRMEDLDTPRVVSGSADQILRDLEWLGVTWDGELIWQSSRTEAYQAALEQLDSCGLTYHCYCSRKDIQQLASAPHGKTVAYPGICANLTEQQREQKAKQKSPATRIRLLGDDVEPELFEGGDFVIKRADGLFAYQLAVTVDDLYQGVTQVVRGDDLRSSTPRQQYLASVLGERDLTPRYWHVPLMLDESGARMAKRDGSASIRAWQAAGKSSEQLVGYLLDSLDLKLELPNALTLEESLSLLTADHLGELIS